MTENKSQNDKVTISFTIDGKLLEYIETNAAKEGRNRSSMIRKMIIEYSKIKK